MAEVTPLSPFELVEEKLKSLQAHISHMLTSPVGTADLNDLCVHAGAVSDAYTALKAWYNAPHLGAKEAPTDKPEPTPDAPAPAPVSPPVDAPAVPGESA